MLWQISQRLLLTNTGDMKGNSDCKYITSEILAAYLEGNTTAEESRNVIQSLCEDDELIEVLRISQAVDEELGMMQQEKETLPIAALAATCEKESLCCIECEGFVLNRRGAHFTRQQLIDNANSNNWLKDGGTPLHNVGRHAESFGYIVTRQYKSNIQDIYDALTAGHDVIVAVDGGELLEDIWNETKEDVFIGQCPDHTIVVLSCDMNNRTVTVYDPNSVNSEDTYTFDQFINAWTDSNKYLVTIKSNDMKNYKPTPIDTTDVVLDESLNELREAIAENAHDIWAVDRLAEGWKYGPKRDEDKKETPCMVPYSQLPEDEKDYDRKMAMHTLKLVDKLGYDLVKREETELYKNLLVSLRNKKVFYCPDCKCHGKKTPVYRGYIYCNVCGHKLDIDWDNY